jgi:serine/threonine protein kinase
MRCPRCGFASTVQSRDCARCGYAPPGGVINPSRGIPARGGEQTAEYTSFLPTRGDMLCEGRYRLVNQIDLPEIQRAQGSAWLATDLMVSYRRVLVREIRVPPELSRRASAESVAYAAVQRLQGSGQHPGLPQVLDFFEHRGTFFLVSLYPEGESLASLLRRQGGALPEAVVAEYGCQLCDILTLLEQQRPPIVHGSLNPETILINTQQQSAWLLHLPLFRPEAAPARSGQVSAGYYAPEQVHGELTPASDLYGLAVTMHHAITGYDPRSRLALFHPPARRLNPAVTAQMEMILARQLSLSLSQRYVHPAQMRKDLMALQESYPAPVAEQAAVGRVNPLELSAAQLREQSKNAVLLNMGVFAAICILLLVGALFAVLR